LKQSAIPATIPTTMHNAGMPTPRPTPRPIASALSTFSLVITAGNGKITLPKLFRTTFMLQSKTCYKLSGYRVVQILTGASCRKVASFLGPREGWRKGLASNVHALRLIIHSQNTCS